MQLSNGKVIHSELSLLSTAVVTLPEPDRMAAARRWLGAGSGIFGEREKFLLEGFWKLLDECPEKPPVTEIRPRFKVYK